VIKLAALMKYLFKILLVLQFVAMVAPTHGQSQSKLEKTQTEIEELKLLLDQKHQELKGYKLEKMHEDMSLYGYPKSPFGGQVIQHLAMALEYVEGHEQASWVYHMILPDIIEGNEGRTNDFRIDSLVSTGSAVEADYFVVLKNEQGEEEFDGFGFDRGHLAPSADFRWHREALSQSYFYSNMSPQRPGFNREIWAEVEDEMRNYVFRTERPLWVITGPVLKDDLPISERSINGVTIPEEYYKIAYDPQVGKAIAFIVPNQKSFNKPKDYVKSVREVETLTGIDFFPLLKESDQVESSTDLEHWLPVVANGDITPLRAEKLPKNHFNSVQASFHVNSGKTVSVCGTVVGSHFSRAGNVLLNFDKGYPNQTFTVFIKGEDLRHFSFSPDIEFKNECICATGKVEKMGDQPAIIVTKENQLKLYKNGQ
jgi:endonuclease G